MNADTQRKIAALQETVGLSRPPVGLAFVSEPPAGIPEPSEGVPSACSLWVMGRDQVVYAPVSTHLNCPIGMMTMGFQVPDDRMEEAKTIVDTMCELEYISPEEAASLPSVPGNHSGVVYGPLANLPAVPDVIIFSTRPGQAMLLAESSGCVDWTDQGMSAFGRPTCAVVPTAIEMGKAAMSVGCIGFRVYTGTPDEELIVAVPKAGLQNVLDGIDTTVNANAALEKFHTNRRATVV
ncbi:MAG: DUF169 domain-containing protein [Dehalococcoidia bacterium]|jgi:uncharacterized protein (DUF169 family)|nr:DUF169 domain-containing protein [Dehalococcoidia bacterium]